MSTYAEFSKMPLYRVQQLALLGDDAAIEESASRYAEDNTRRSASPRHRMRVAYAWTLGFRGQPNPYAVGRGGNFAAPLRSAYQDGARLKREGDAPFDSDADCFACLHGRSHSISEHEAALRRARDMGAAEPIEWDGIK